ncbi:hypothetical protein ACWCQN_00880 [Streptomyces sp. NPDC001984]|uniref:hypothetical protein n=1 Tax=Streptomyces sp. NPDC002619 TaxID=3364655 RepID=UPI0036934036
MTMHAVVLPGYQPHPTSCRQDGCEANLGIVTNYLLPLQRWEAALASGPEAIDTYLAEHNAKFRSRHSPGCPFQDLPPAVHAKCQGIRNDRTAWQQLVNELQRLDNARRRQQPEGGQGSD